MTSLVHCLEGAEYYFCLCGMELAALFDTDLKFIKILYYQAWAL
jgi:hypothetical protein